MNHMQGKQTVQMSKQMWEGRIGKDASTVISEKSKTIKYIKSILVNVCAYKSKKWHWAVDESMRKDMWGDLLSNLKIVTRKDVNRIH